MSEVEHFLSEEHTLAGFELQSSSPHSVEHVSYIAEMLVKRASHNDHVIDIHQAVGHLETCQHQVHQPLKSSRPIA